MKWRRGMKVRKGYNIDYQRFADNLNRMMAEQDLYSSKLARIMETTPQVVDEWMSGERAPQIWTVCILADKLGTTVEELLEGVVVKLEGMVNA